MNRIVLSTTLALAAATPLALHGEDFTETPNRWSLGPRFGMNFKAVFNHNATATPGPAIAGVDHTYNDGYVKVDSSGDAGGLTSNWGYQNASQVVGGTMAFHALQSDSHTITDEPQYGAELIYQRVIGSLPFLSPSVRWGLEGAFAHTDLDLRDNRNGPVAAITDTYPLNGVLPPGAGYNGTFTGPGALLGDTPTRTSAIATQMSRQRLSGQLYSIRLGPFLEWNFTDQLSLSASVGLTLAPAAVKYDFSETTTLAGVTSSANGHSSTVDLLYGPYVSAMLRYDFSQHWGVYIGGQFQNLTDSTQTSGNRTARLDLGATVFATVGASWRF